MTVKLLRTLVVVLIVVLFGVVAFVYSGAFNIAADVPHSSLVYRLLETTRQRSIAARASGIDVPRLDDPKRIAEGGEHYAAMCTGCHLAPDTHESELRDGLYPQPPDFTQRSDIDPAQMFWAIKHGVKLTAMPAWGKLHDDDAIWNLVAFVKKLPDMTPEQYQQTTASGGGHEHHHHGQAAHEHDHGEEHEQAGHDHGDEAPDHGGADHDHASEQHGAHEQKAELSGDREHAPSADRTQRQSEVHARGPQAMPFALDSTQHIFEKTPEGGIQRVVAREGHAEQIAKVREHLQSIAHAFTARDFSSPVHIHGADMPGLAELKAAAPSELTVSYRDIDRGGELAYRGTTESVRNAIHRWFDAQLSDHGHDAIDQHGHAHGT